MDLFSSSEPTALQLPGAELQFYQRFELGCDHSALLHQLIADTQWQQEDITLFGKTHAQPRLIAWHGDKEARYSYSGISHEPLPWTEQLQKLRLQVQDASGHKFNSVLLNYYRDQNDSMGLHADDEPELGPEPAIASLSLGEERILYFKHKFRRDLTTVNLPLPSSSLLLMRGATQRNWKHGLRKSRKPCGPRVNLTFRLVLGSA